MYLIKSNNILGSNIWLRYRIDSGVLNWLRNDTCLLDSVNYLFLHCFVPRNCLIIQIIFFNIMIFFGIFIFIIVYFIVSTVIYFLFLNNLKCFVYFLFYFPLKKRCYYCMLVCNWYSKARFSPN